MVEDSFRKIDGHDYIKDNLNNIIEAFVTLYGEEEREFITQRFNSTFITTFGNIDTFESNIRRVKSSVLKEVFGIDEGHTFFFEVDKLYEDFVNLTTEEMDFIDYEDLNLLFGEKDPKVIIENIKNNKYPKVQEFIAKFKPVMERLAPYEEKLNRYQEMKRSIDDKYFDMLVNDFAYLIPSHEIDAYKMIGFPTTFMSYYFGFGITSGPRCFDEEAEKILNDPNTDWEKDSIIDDRMKFFEAMGFNLKGKGDFALNPPTYEDYLKLEGIDELITRAKSDFKMISARRKELMKLRNYEILENMEEYVSVRKQIDALDLVDKDDPFGPFLFNSLSPVSCFTENYKFDGENYILSPLVFISLDGSSTDNTIMHELNHLYEHHTISVNSNGDVAISGWDISNMKFRDHQSDDNYDGITRKYELLSEYINERLAQTLTDIMHSRGQHIYSPYVDKDLCVYMCMQIFLEDFFQEFKGAIIKSRSHGNIDVIYNEVGKENFEALNDLCNDFYDKFGYGSQAEGIISLYKDKKDTKDAYEVAKFVERKNEILQRMREYKNSKVL